MTYTTGTLTGTFHGLDGAAASGRVVVIPSAPVLRDTAGNVVLAGSLGATLDASGSFSLTLPATDSAGLDPAGVTYTALVSLATAGQITTTGITVNTGTTVDLADVVSVNPVSEAPTYATLAGQITTNSASIAANTSSITGLSATKRDTARTALPVYVYGNSFGTTIYASAGKHYAQLVQAALGAASMTTYAVGGQRIAHVCATMSSGSSNGNDYPNVIAAGLWPGTSSRRGLVVIESSFNDTGHYPAMNVSVVQPAQITSANTRYLDGLKGMYRLALALASTESRIEQTAGTFTGTWANQALAVASASGGTVAYTTSVGAAIQWTVTPPQSGPHAGKVFISTDTLDASFTMAPVNIQVDGGTATPYTLPAWEQYVGALGQQVATIQHVIAVTVPIDGASHTVKMTHNGAAGNFMYADALLVPSETPNPIAVMGCETPPNVVSGVFTQANVNAFRYNIPLVAAAIKSVVSEFPNAFYVPSTMTSNGIRASDGIHPNDRGNAQRANDLLAALQVAQPFYANQTLRDTADSAFAQL